MTPRDPEVFAGETGSVNQTNALIADLARLRRIETAWLAEHDETPLTPDLLPALGFTKAVGSIYWRLGFLETSDCEYWSTRDGDFGKLTNPTPRTLGELRQLCNRLGIPLEPPRL